MHQKKCKISVYHYVRDMHLTAYPNIKGRLIQEFKNQIDYLVKHHNIIRIEDYAEFLKGNKDIPDNSCALSFDDGIKDHFTTVFPILKKLGLKACFFPMTQPLVEGVVPVVQKVHFLLDKLGSKKFAEEFNKILKASFPELVKDYFVNEGETKLSYKWDDPLTANLKYKITIIPIKVKVNILNTIFSKYFEDESEFCRELYMNREEMREMAEEGMSFGGHTHTHPLLSVLNKTEQTWEIKTSKDILEKELNTKTEVFSYPYGEYPETAVDILKSLGYSCAVVDNSENKDEHIFRINRIDTNDLPFKEQSIIR